MRASWRWARRDRLHPAVAGLNFPVSIQYRLARWQGGTSSRALVSTGSALQSYSRLARPLRPRGQSAEDAAKHCDLPLRPAANSELLLEPCGPDQARTVAGTAASYTHDAAGIRTRSTAGTEHDRLRASGAPGTLASDATGSGRRAPHLSMWRPSSRALPQPPAMRQRRGAGPWLLLNLLPRPGQRQILRRRPLFEWRGL